MNSQICHTVHAKMQGRESRDQQPRQFHRSLGIGPGQLSLRLSGFAPLRLCLKLAFLVTALMLPLLPAGAQEVDDTIRIKTRVVFLDALVKERKTGLPISNLALEKFEVLDEGKPRNIS